MDMPYTGLHGFMCISLFAQSYSSIIQYNQLVIEDESKSERHRKKNETLFFCSVAVFLIMSCCVFGIDLCMFCVFRCCFVYLSLHSQFRLSFVVWFVIFSLAIFIFACRRTIFVYSLPITLYTLFFALLLTQLD